MTMINGVSFNPTGNPQADLVTYANARGIDQAQAKQELEAAMGAPQQNNSAPTATVTNVNDFKPTGNPQEDVKKYAELKGIDQATAKQELEAKYGTPTVAMQAGNDTDSAVKVDTSSTSSLKDLIKTLIAEIISQMKLTTSTTSTNSSDSTKSSTSTTSSSSSSSSSTKSTSNTSSSTKSTSSSSSSSSSSSTSSYTTRQSKAIDQAQNAYEQLRKAYASHNGDAISAAWTMYNNSLNNARMAGLKKSDIF